MADGETSIPFTKVVVSPEREASIRSAVRNVSTLSSDSQLAEPHHAEALYSFISDPRVHAPIYSLPRPLRIETVVEFILGHQKEREAGEGLLFIRTNQAGEIVGYSDFQIWPQWAAGELGGALHPDLQSKGRGGAGAANSFKWMFEVLKLDLICATSAQDNIRTAKLLDRIGFEKKGHTLSTRPDGSTRQSDVWELSRSAWNLAHGSK